MLIPNPTAAQVHEVAHFDTQLTSRNDMAHSTARHSSCSGEPRIPVTHHLRNFPSRAPDHSTSRHPDTGETPYILERNHV